MALSKKYTTLISYVSVALMLLMLLLRNGLKMSIPPSLILMVSVIPALVGNPSQMIAMVACFIPMGAGFQIKYALLAYVIIGIVRYRKSLQLSGMMIPVVLMMVWELAHGVGMEFSLNEYLREFAELILLVFVSMIKWDKVDFKIIARLLSVATVGVCLIIIYMQINSGLSGLIELLSQGAAEYRFGIDNTEEGTAYGMNFNPNELGFICNLSIATTLTLIARREHATLDVVLMLLCVFFGFITLSRTYVLVLIFMAGCFIFFSPGSRRERTLNILLLMMAAPVMLWLIWNYLPSVMENFLGRMEVDDITNGRSYLMTFYNDHIFSSFSNCFWGIGLQDYGARLVDMYGHQIEVCHNGIQEIWVTWGFVGVMLFGWMLLELIKQSKRWSGKRHLFAYVPLAMMLLSSMAGQLISSGNSLITLSICYVILSMRWNSPTKTLR